MHYWILNYCQLLAERSTHHTGVKASTEYAMDLQNPNTTLGYIQKENQLENIIMSLCNRLASL